MFGFIPSLPTHDVSRYWFLAVAIMGATLVPNMFSFYSAGAVEEEWGVKDLPINRITAGICMSFGGGGSMAGLAGAAVTNWPLGINLDPYDPALPMLHGGFGHPGLYLFRGSKFSPCFPSAPEG